MRSISLPLAAVGLALLGACGADDRGAPDTQDPTGSAPAVDVPAADVTNPTSPPPIGTDVGAAQGDTATVLAPRGEVTPSTP